MEWTDVQMLLKVKEIGGRNKIDRVVSEEIPWEHRIHAAIPISFGLEAARFV